MACFQQAPFNKQRRDRSRVHNPNELNPVSHTTHISGYSEEPTTDIALEIDTQYPNTQLIVNLTSPAELQKATFPSYLQEGNTIHFRGVTYESFTLERLAGPTEKE